MPLDFPQIDFTPPGTATAATPFGKLSEDEWGRYAFLKGIGPEDASAPPYDQAMSAFERLADTLYECGMDFSDVVRTWIYADGILDWYADLNRARDDFFRMHGVGAKLLPASTGHRMRTAQRMVRKRK